jgi:hypothetical protein
VRSCARRLIGGEARSAASVPRMRKGSPPGVVAFATVPARSPGTI